MRLRRSSGSESGFTLVEVMAALTVFALITLGIVPLMASSMRASNLARSRTVAENVARAAMERALGIRYFVSYAAKPKKVDLLDLYYPQASGTGYQANASNPPLTGSGGVYTTQCPPATGTNPACPTDLPSGYTVAFKASFVKPNPGTNPQTYKIVTPSSTFAWNTQGQDTPAADLLDLGVTVAWTLGGKAKSFTLRTIVGDRRFSPGGTTAPGPSPTATPPPAPGALKLRARADLDYIIEVSTGFSSSSTGVGCSSPPCTSELIQTLGMSHSRIETQTYSTADQEARAGNIRIVRTNPQGSPPPPDLAYADGAVSVRHAPPAYSVRGIDSSAGQQVVSHPDLGTQVSMLEPTNTNKVEVDVSSEIPVARGFFQSTAGAPQASEAWVHNTQADFAGMLLDNDTNDRMIAVRKGGDLDYFLYGYSSAETGRLGLADRRVETNAFGQFESFKLLRLNLTTALKPYLVEVQNFTAQVRCESKPDTAAADASASWSADLIFQADTTSDGRVNPTAQTMRLTGAPGADPLATIGAGAGKTNYLVNDPAGTSRDIWLFDDPAQSRKGYLASWSTNKSLLASKSTNGRTTSASIDGAIRIDTAPLNPAVPETTVNVSIGKLRCEAVDNR